MFWRHSSNKTIAISDHCWLALCFDLRCCAWGSILARAFTTPPVHRRSLWIWMMKKTVQLLRSPWLLEKGIVLLPGIPHATRLNIVIWTFATMSIFVYAHTSWRARSLVCSFSLERWPCVLWKVFSGTPTSCETISFGRSSTYDTTL